MARYTEAHKRASLKYEKSHLKRVPFSVQKEYYDSVLKPAADRAGEPVNTFIKNAISLRINTENLAPVLAEKKYYIRSAGYNLIATYDGTVAKWKQTDEEPSCLSRDFDTSSWDSEEVDNFDEFFGIGNGSEILAEAAI